MLRGALLGQQGVGDRSFRWRGAEVTRLEGFSDTVFGFALTLLVVSLQVPQTFDDLITAMRGYGAFAVSFALLAYIWYEHYMYFRRYGLQDGVTLLLNLVLLFVVLFYVYPLKFLFNLFLGAAPSTIHLPDGQIAQVIKAEQVSTLFVIYGLGFSSVFAIFLLLYAHAYRERRLLQLSPLGRSVTRWEIVGFVTFVAVGLLSAAVAVIVPESYVYWAGYTYFLVAVVRPLEGVAASRRQRRPRPEEVNST